MCTSIVEICEVDGEGKGERGWFPLTRAVVSYDHPHHALFEEAIVIDFVDARQGPEARVAVEISLDSARSLHAALARAIEAADEVEGIRQRPA